jgi:PAS domain S-box-containing protein
MNDPTAMRSDGPDVAGPAATFADPSRQIRAEQTRLLMDGVRSGIPASIAVAGVMAYVQWPVIDHFVVASWLTAVLFISLLRGAVVFLYARSTGKGSAKRFWLPLFIAGTALAGALWGAGAWLLYPANSVAHQAFLGVLVAGLTAGAVTSLCASLTATLLFLLLSLAPLAIRFLSSDQSVIFALGLLTILFLAVTAIGARRINGSIVHNIRLRLRDAEQVSAIRRSEEHARKLSMVAARTDNAVVITDRQGRIEWVNDGFTRVSGYSQEEVVGRTPGSVLQGPETDDRVIRRIREKLQRGEGFKEEILNYAKDGRPYWIAIEVQPIRDEAGEIVQFMAIERDVTDVRVREQQLEEARRKAEEANQAKSSFLAMMSHEVRTPLNGVLGSLGLLQDTSLDAEQRKYVETSRRSAEWLLSVINNILDFSKMESGKIALEPAVFRVTALVESVVEMLAPRASEKAISILADVDPAVPPVAEGDATKIRQVLLNLAANGVKFTSKGEVRVGVKRLARSGDETIWLRFAVTDTGEGIAEEQQANVFEEFWTWSAPKRHHGEGTGLGLSISHQLVDVLGGQIGFESQLGIGSHFWFDVPLGAASSDSVPPDEQSSSDAGTGGEATARVRLLGRVLLAEDNPANQMIAQAMLARLGLHVDVVSNGLEAVDAVRSRPYDLILMDIGMPEMDGIEATRTIRAMDEPKAGVPVVAVTAHVMRGERESLLAQGFDDYVAKPIDRAALVDCLKRWVEEEDDGLTILDSSVSSGQGGDPEAAIDRSVLEQLLEDVGRENAGPVIDAFIGELEAQAVVLDGAAAENDLEAMGQYAHRLKGSAASFGALRLSDVSAAIEQAAKAGDLTRALDRMPEFRALCKESLQAIVRFRQDMAGTSD